MKDFRRFLVLAAFSMLTIGAALPALAVAPTLPVTGAEVDAWIPVIITAMGATVLAVAGGYFVFLVIKRGFVWARKALG